MGMKNDVSFLLAGDLNLYEQQSSWNPNMPLRSFLYAAHAVEKYISLKDIAAAMYDEILVRIPTPKLIVVYNGEKEVEDQTLKLSDCFMDPDGGDLEAVVHVYNISTGKALPSRCRPLSDYSVLVEAYRDGRRMGLDSIQAMDQAVAILPDGAVKQYVISQRSEVADMLLTEYDENAVVNTIRERSIKEGADLLGALYLRMQETGADMSDFGRAAGDAVFREKMYKKFGIV